MMPYLRIGEMCRKEIQKPVVSKVRFTAIVVATAIFVGLLFPVATPAQSRAAGLEAKFTCGEKHDTAVASNVCLYVPAGQAATPFLSHGRFSATWSGFLTIDVPGDYGFGARLNGTLKLEINGQPVIDDSTNGVVVTTKPVWLGKGATNTLKATFRSPAEGDAMLRLQWHPPGSFVQPFPSDALSHEASAEEKTADTIRVGRELFIEHRCAQCHARPKPDNAIPDLAMDAPTFENIGSRRNYDWMKRWILDPKKLQPTTVMPRMIGTNTDSDAEAMAAFLASLRPAGWKVPEAQTNKEDAEVGKLVFEALLCVACHNPPDATEPDPGKVSLNEVGAKFVSGTLDSFLKQPAADFQWTGMPQFKIAERNRQQLLAYVLAGSEKLPQIAAPADKAMIERGRELVQTSGCLNCHGLKTENRFTGKPLSELTNWTKGCLSETPSGKAPQFGFSAAEREALQEFAATDRLSLERQVPADFAERNVRRLKCSECHGKFDGFPRMEILGGKLRPEWMTRFIGGEIDKRVRPWLDAQMPAFPMYAKAISEGLAMQHGFPPHSPEQGPINPELVKVGRQLVASPPTGFSCISCHSIGAYSPPQAFDTPGVNLALTGERLQPAYFKRWVRNPPTVDPMAKMPAFFDTECRSPVANVFNGDGDRQIDAIWEYIRLGDKMPLPKTDQ